MVASLLIVIGIISTLGVMAHYHSDVLWKSTDDSISDSVHFKVPEGQDIPDTLQRIDKPTYVPRGYHLEQEVTDKLGYNVTYTNGDAMICYTQTTYDVGLEIDSEDMEITEGEINGYPAKKYVKDERTIVVWSTDSYVYMVSGETVSQKIVKMAESVKCNSK